MTRQYIDVEGYWQVVVFYDIDYNLFDYIADELYEVGATRRNIDSIFETMVSGNGKAFTYSNPDDKVSIIGFNRHEEAEDYINSIVHEAEHVKQAMLYAYQVEDSEEPPAYTIGFLGQLMYRVFRDFVC